MSIDDRVVALEKGLAAMQSAFLVHLNENKRQMVELNKMLTVQGAKSRDIDHNLTMLLGMVIKQGERIEAVEERVGRLDDRLYDVNQRVESGFEAVDKRISALESRVEGGFELVDKRLGLLEGRFTTMEGKFDQVLVMLSRLTGGSE